MLEILVVEFLLRSEHIDEFAVSIAANAKASLEREPGCLRFDVCRDPANPALFFLYEIYSDDTAVQAHLTSPHFLQMNGQTAAWVQNKVVRRLQLEAGT